MEAEDLDRLLLSVRWPVARSLVDATNSFLEIVGSKLVATRRGDYLRFGATDGTGDEGRQDRRFLIASLNSKARSVDFVEV